jgi:lycopene beta-cyclase
VTPGGTARHAGGRHAYVHLDARDVYATALTAIDADPATELVLGVTVEAVAPGPVVRTDRGAWRAGRVYDGRTPSPLEPPPRPAARRTGITLNQAFLGWQVRTARPVFDPATATLMDFRVPQDGGLRFLYTLPFAPDRALVEDTSIVAPGGGPTAAERRALLEAHLGETLAAVSWSVEHEEYATIAMAPAAPAARPHSRVHPIGTAAGAVRPSSGYAFARIQRHCRALARAVVTGAEPPERAGAARGALLDRVFLRALHDDPAAFPEHFRRLVAGTPPDAFARFMNDEATAGDEARVIAALPKAPFAMAALRALTAAARR